MSKLAVELHPHLRASDLRTRGIDVKLKTAMTSGDSGIPFDSEWAAGDNAQVAHLTSAEQPACCSPFRPGSPIAATTAIR